jgi:hypothetical protein
VLRFMLTLLTLHRARLGYLRDHPDEGSVTLEKVVITAIIVAAAVGAGVLLRDLIEQKGDEIENEVNGG